MTGKCDWCGKKLENEIKTFCSGVCEDMYHNEETDYEDDD